MTPETTAKFRIEHDSMGPVRVPTRAKWAAQTQRAVENFPISGVPVDRSLVQALAQVKAALAAEKLKRRMMPRALAEAVIEAAGEVVAGRWDDQFPIDVYQTGSGTSSNMNVNEVLATLAAERLGRPVHPNDDVNAPLSSNDQFPTAVRLAAARAIAGALVADLGVLSSTLRKQERKWARAVKAGRTHLMDATPVTVGQEFGGYAQAIDNGLERLDTCLPRLCELPLGGTAVGTGLNAPRGLAAAVIARLAGETGLPLREARNHFEAQGTTDALVEVSGVLRVIAVSLYKVANDVRWMSSGPRCGLGEIHLPDLQPGSSIMPGKVNPVIPEAVCQVVAQVIGNDAGVAFAGTAGAFELNVMLPVIASNLLESIRLLGSVSRIFAERCLAGMEVDEARCHIFALSSPAIATALVPYLGYEKTAEVVQEAMATGRDLRQVVLARRLMSAAKVDEALDVLAMTRGGVVGASAAKAGRARR
jgi:fumarate hydratase class II